MNVRRSRVHATELGTHPFRSPYRCLDCDARFWVVSRRARYGAAAGAAVMLALVAFVGIQMILRPAIPRAESTRVTNSASPARDSLESIDRRTLDDIIKIQSDVMDKELKAPARTPAAR